MLALLLTFFIMLVSLSEIQADKKFRAVLESVAKKMGYPMGPLAPEGKHFPLNAMIEHMTKLGSHSNQTGRGGVKAKGLPAGENDQPHTRVTRKRDGIAVDKCDYHFLPRQEGSGPPTTGGGRGFGPQVVRKTAQDRMRSSTSPLKGKVGEGDVNPRMFAYERARRVAERLKQGGVDPERIKFSSVGTTSSPSEMKRKPRRRRRIASRS